jgi:nucleoside-diphosphate-sugar epimerase
MNILIAGGAGYIGTRLSNSLIKKGHEVTVVDLLWFGNNLDKKVKLVKKNLIDLDQKDLLGYDAVVFMAGLSNDPMANFSPKVNFIENAAAPSYLAYVAKKAGIPRFVYASSCSVYGFTDGEIMTEESSVAPEYPYGISKLQTEYSVMKMKDKYFRPISLRKGTVGGWSPRMRFDLVVNTMTKCALVDKKITVHNPNLWRPLVDVRDVVSAYECSIFSDLKISGIFNVCNENYKIGALSKDITEELRRNNLEVEIDVQNRPDVRNYLASNEKAKKILNFYPKYSPRDSIKEILSNIDLNKFNFEDKKYYNIRTFKDLNL